MVRKKITPDLKASGTFFKTIFTLVLTLLLVSLLAACAAPATTTQAPLTSAPTITIQTQTSSVLATTTTPLATTTAAAAKPQGEVVAALQIVGNENFLPWLDAGSGSLYNLVYDMLIYWDHVNRKFLPGLAESWEVSPDGFTLTYHLRKDVQFTDGWGELTAEDIKYNFEMQASPKSIGKATQCRRIASMDTPNPYTLVVHFKDPFPTFFVEMGMATGGVCQGIVCKKYLESVGEDVASQKPIGSGPYRLVESKSGSYFKFEALDSHWRIVPEFKTLTVRVIPETSTLIAALKNKEVDLSGIPAEQLVDLKAAGVAVELSPGGGGVIVISWGGITVPADKRYDPAYHNKDPWVDPKVRKAMAMAIDREAICKSIFAGLAEPVSVPMFSKTMNKYQYSFDPTASKQLLAEAGYPKGFSFKIISYVLAGAAETPRLVEAIAGYWQQIGLDPQITTIEYATYNLKYRTPNKMAGEISLYKIGIVGDYLSRVEMYLLPNVVSPVYQDTGSYA